MLIIEKDKMIKINQLIKLKGGLAPHASPIMSEPIFGNRNSALEIVARDFIALDIISKLSNQDNLKIFEYGVLKLNFNNAAIGGGIWSPNSPIG